jgi:hypothetical protein
VSLHRRIAVVAALCALTVATGPAAPSYGATPGPTPSSDGHAAWTSAPAQLPPTPTGAQPSPYPVGIGSIGDIEFWGPNRGVLITAGNALVPAGLYAYDGLSWHQLATVCGGTDGRIAWAGPDEFWTISDERPLSLNGFSPVILQDASLCHFDNGQVVASYSMPVSTIYPTMNAAACASASDCWFGGDGGFHLHWDGTTLSEVDSANTHAASAMAVDRGQILESLQLQSPADAADSHPALLNLIAPWDAADPFHSLYLQDKQDTDPLAGCGSACPPLPDYGTIGGTYPGDYWQGTTPDANDPAVRDPVDPGTLNSLALSSDWAAGAGDPQLWAVAGVQVGVNPAVVNGQTDGQAEPVVLRYADGVWTQLAPNLVDPADWLSNTLAPVTGSASGNPGSQTVAAEPDKSAAWIGMSDHDVIGSNGGEDQDNIAHVDRMAVDMSGSTPAARITDQDALGPAQGVGPRGNTTALTCPAAQDCWLGTDQGWLFHLSVPGAQLPQDGGPDLAGVITTRPPDAATAVLVGAGTIEAVAVPPPPNIVNPVIPTAPARTRAKALVTHMSRSRLVHRATLELSFTLTARARVQLIARRHGRVVAETHVLVLRAGRHTLTLRLDVHRWPTALALHAKVAARS